MATAVWDEPPLLLLFVYAVLKNRRAYWVEA
jgi:hypothetical protein